MGKPNLALPQELLNPVPEMLLRLPLQDGAVRPGKRHKAPRPRRGGAGGAAGRPAGGTVLCASSWSQVRCRPNRAALGRPQTAAAVGGALWVRYSPRREQPSAQSCPAVDTHRGAHGGVWGEGSPVPTL